MVPPLVNDVLIVSKLESGRPSVVEEPFDLHTILETCITILSIQAEEIRHTAAADINFP